jgi:hypothetical protein
MLLRNVPLIFRRRASRTSRRAAKAAPPALTLLEAEFTYVGPGGALRLEFDRAIDITSFVASAITVQDPSGSGFGFVGTGVVDTPDAQTVVVEMGSTGTAEGTLDVLSATAATGIVAVDNAGTWPGVTGLGLPYP